MNSAGRTPATDCFLRHGNLRFTSRWHLPSGTPRATVLALHGFPDTPLTFAPLLDGLLTAGYQVVTPVMRGYEFSSIPADNDFQMAALARDVAAWLDQPPLAGTPVHLLGHDWGAVAGYAAVGLLGTRLASFTALAIPPPANLLAVAPRAPRQVARFWYQYLALLPGLSERIYRADDFALIERLWRNWSPGLEPPAALLAGVRERFRQPGVLTAALRYYRALYSYHLPGRWETERLFRTPVQTPTLILNGAEDGCIGADVFRQFVARQVFERGMRHVTLPECGHWLHRERPGEILQHLLPHLEGAERSSLRSQEEP